MEVAKLLVIATLVSIVTGLSTVNAAKPFVLTVERNMSCSDGNVNGRLLVDGTEVARTLEPGPEGNRIPIGEFDASIRADGILGWRIELKDVPGWENVEIHLGNYPSNSKGCILVGVSVAEATDPATGKKTCAVLNSADAIKAIQSQMQTASEDGVSSQQLSIRVIVQ